MAQKHRASLVAMGVTVRRQTGRRCYLRFGVATPAQQQQHPTAQKLQPTLAQAAVPPACATC